MRRARYTSDGRLMLQKQTWKELCLKGMVHTTDSNSSHSDMPSNLPIKALLVINIGIKQRLRMTRTVPKQLAPSESLPLTFPIIITTSPHYKLLTSSSEIKSLATLPVTFCHNQRVSCCIRAEFYAKTTIGIRGNDAIEDELAINVGRRCRTARFARDVECLTAA
jgi:hypothetical protein